MKKNVKNDSVIRAIASATAGMLALTTAVGSIPMQVYAVGEDEFVEVIPEEEKATDLTPVVVTPASSETPEDKTETPEVETPSTPIVVIDTTEVAKVAIPAAEQAIDNATKQETIAGFVAIPTHGQGIILDEIQAVQAEKDAKNKVEELEKAIAENDAVVQADLDALEAAKKDAEEAAKAAEEAKAAAAEAAAEAEANNQAAQGTENIGSAYASAVAAGANADEAQKQADIAAEEAQKAQEAFDKATEAYDKALDDIAAAQKKYDEITDKASEEAAEALAEATSAREKAESLKADMDKALAAANTKVDEKQQALNQAKADLAVAKAAVKTAAGNEVSALVKTGETGAALLAADAVVVATQAALDFTNLTIAGKEAQLKIMEAKKTALEDAIDKLEKKVAELETEKSEDEKEVEDAKAALEAAKNALTSAETALSEASRTLETIKKEREELDDEDYEKAVVEAEKKLQQAKEEAAKDENNDGSAVKNATDALVQIVVDKIEADKNEADENAEKNNASSAIEYDQNGNTIFRYSDEEGNSTYYSYEVAEDGKISVYENDRKTEIIGINEEKSYATEEEFNQVKSAVEKTVGEGNYTTEHTPAQEATYDITYKTVEHEAGTTSTCKGRDVIGKTLPDGAYITVKAWTGIIYNYRQEADGRWKCTAYGTGYLGEKEDVVIHYNEVVYSDAKTATVKESELDKYKNKIGEPTLNTPAVAESWKITVNTAPVVKDNLTEAGKNEEVKKLIAQGKVEGVDFEVTEVQGQTSNTEEKHLRDDIFSDKELLEKIKSGEVEAMTPSGMKLIYEDGAWYLSKKNKKELVNTDNNRTMMVSTVTAGDTTYIITDNSILIGDVYTKKTDVDAKTQANISDQIVAKDAEIETAKSNLSQAETTKNEKEAAKSQAEQDVAKAEKDLDDTTKALNAYQTALDKLNEAYDKEYKGTYITLPIIGSVQVKPSEYDKKVAEINLEIATLKAEAAIIKNVTLPAAKAAQKKASDEHDKAVENLKDATKNLVDAVAAEKKAEIKVGTATVELNDAIAKRDAVKAADDYLGVLVDKTKVAEAAALEAKNRVDALKAITKGLYTEELAKAEADYDAAKKAAEDAQKSAEDAQDEADKAKESYENALARVEELIEEAQRQNPGAEVAVVYAVADEYFAAAPVAEGAVAAAPAAVLGANRAVEANDADTVGEAAVLGARRSSDNEGAVLGARRGAKTDDMNALGMYVAMAGAAAFAGAGYVALRRKEEEAE